MLRERRSAGLSLSLVARLRAGDTSGLFRGLNPGLYYPRELELAIPLGNESVLLKPVVDVFRFGLRLF